MALVTSGEISMGGNATSGSLNRSINIELSRAAGATSNLNETALRTLAGIPTSGSTISLASFYNKSSITISLSSVTSNEPFEAQAIATFEPVEVVLDFAANGTWLAIYSFGTPSGNWATPTTIGIGSSYWIRFTRTSFSGSLGGNTATPSTGWLQLSGAGISVYNAGGGADAIASAEYTIEIATDSGGSNIVASATFITLRALAFGV
jgi:hypothetical protein